MNQQIPHTNWGLVHSIPRPIPDWNAQILEYLFLLGVTLWMGAHTTSALLVAPLVLKVSPPTLEMSLLLIKLIENLGYIASAASGILLLTTVGMHLMQLRSRRTILLQLGLILVMTIAAVLPILWLVPKLTALLRMAALADGQMPETSLDVLTRIVAGIGTVGALHLFFGAILASLGVRRSYRYI